MSRLPVRRILFSTGRFRCSSRRPMSFAGTHTALVTPFRDGAIDSDAFRELIEAQIAGGVEGIVPVGTTGESPTLTYEEHTEVIRVAIETAKGRCKVIAGTGSNSTVEAVSLTTEAEKLGADAVLLVAPYYNKPSQEGLYRHYRKSRSCFTVFPAAAGSKSEWKRSCAWRAIAPTLFASRNQEAPWSG